MKKLLIITDNGLYKKNKEYFFNTPNYIFYNILKQNYNKIDFIAKDGKIEKNYFLCPRDSEVILLKRTNLYLYIKTLIRTVKKYDVVLCFGINGLVASFITKYYRIPTINYVGGSLKEFIPYTENIIKKIILLTVDKILKLNVKRAKYVHYCDESTKKKYPTNGKYLVCSSAFIEYDILNLKKRLLKYKNLSNVSKIKLGIIGYTNNKIKGMDTLIKALIFLPKNIYLEIVGGGNHDWLDKIVQKYDLTKRVKFLGVISKREEIFEWLDTVDIYLQPSRTEGLPRATIEAMSKACPVVSSITAGGLKYLIDERFLIKEQKAKELARVIQIFLEDYNLMREQSIVNFKKSKQFSKDIRDKKFDEFYSKI